MWACSACTFENQLLRQTCEVCESPREGGGHVQEPPSSWAQPPPPLPVARPMAPPMQEMMVTVPPGVGPGSRLTVQPPYGGAPVMVTVPPGVGPGGQMRVQVGGQASPPPAISGPQPDWTCSQCTLHNNGAVAVCAACEGPRPVAPPSQAPPNGWPPADDDEQLAWALAASREGRPAAPRLAMAEAAEAEAIRVSAEEERVRMHARVAPSIARVAGDSRGTASTLVRRCPSHSPLPRARPQPPTHPALTHISRSVSVSLSFTPPLPPPPTTRTTHPHTPLPLPFPHPHLHPHGHRYPKPRSNHEVVSE